MKLSLSRFTIRQQMWIGYMPVLIVLAFWSYTNYQNFEEFEENFLQFQNITQENVIFLEIENDILEMQRNVVVYSYMGYQGIIKKIEFIEKNLEEKFLLIQPIALQNQDVNDRFNRMLGHYNDYKAGFHESVLEREVLKSFSSKNLYMLSIEQHEVLVATTDFFLQQRMFESAYKIEQIKNNLLQAESKLDSYQNSPDSLLIKEANALISDIKIDGKALFTEINNAEISQIFQTFLNTLENYKEIFKNMERLSRNYLQLNNVVLAGKAAEIDKLSNELDELITERSDSLSVQIQSNANDSKSQFVILSIVTGLLGLLSSVIIAMGIANPVSAMATTLSRLATGAAETEIPGLNRKDEVGQMAMAANEFKIMANNLESQTEELEEFSYRTSHDLRSPLKSAIGLLSIAEQSIKKDRKEDTVKTLDMAISSLSKLDTLVGDILVLTKAKNEVEDNQPVDIQEIFDETLFKLTHMDNFDHIQFKTNFNFNNEFYTMKSRLVLIVENLISNAIKYQDLTKEQSIVELSTNEENNCFVLTISDNGLSIPADQHHKLFTMFKRFHPKTSFGSGLGLYMIKKSVDILKGEIIFEDTKEGSLFRIIIPTVKH